MNRNRLIPTAQGGTVLPYGGTKISGVGRELSVESMVEHFTWPKTVIINYGTPTK